MYYGPLWFELIRFLLFGICLCWKPAHSLAQCVMVPVCSSPTSQVNELAPLINSYGQIGYSRVVVWGSSKLCDLNKYCPIVGISG